MCFVDTLDNLGFSYAGKQNTLFGATAENTERIKRQNSKKISVIIGNPPYNARQDNYNFQNANKVYKEIDKRIKGSFIKQGTAQNQIVIYDMFTRFYRWSIDRLTENGIIAFITNRSFIDGRAFDGFRKIVSSEFNYIYIIDLGGDVRMNPKLSGPKHNVFGIQTGVAIMILVRKNNIINAESKKELNQLKREFNVVEDPLILFKTKEFYSSFNTRILYARRPELETAIDKLQFLASSSLVTMQFESIVPDKKNNWINQTENNFEELLPLIDKNLKMGKNGHAVFKTFSLGIDTHRDAWVYDNSTKSLSEKIKYFIEIYSNTLKDPNYPNKDKIAWSRELTKYFKRNIELHFDEKNIKICHYRPYFKQYHYYDKHFNSYLFLFPKLINDLNTNCIISIRREGNTKPFHLLATNATVDLHTTGDSQCLPMFYFDDNGKSIENITDWGLQQFHDHYIDTTITKENIFHYVYAILHDPTYRTKYELNLKRDFPRIPFYEEFAKWAAWGKQLMNFHINYETVEPFDLKVITVKDIENPKPKLKADKDTGTIILDEATTLTRIPIEAWQYKLGNRSALEWILDQYKEKKPTDPTIAEKFNTYRFADYKIHVIDLLRRVCTVSVETMKVINEMSGK